MAGWSNMTSHVCLEKRVGDMISEQILTEQTHSKEIDNLWSKNTPVQFWQVNHEIDPNIWQEAIAKACVHSGLPINRDHIDQVLHYTLGEGRFGKKHWDLSLFNRLYWQIKPILPHQMIQSVRGIVHKTERRLSKRNWPIDDGYICFQWETLRQLLLISGRSSILFKNFWPDHHSYSLVLTHDVETVEGQSYIPQIADLEEKYGFRSSFNIVGDQIPQDMRMLKEIVGCGFEIGLHGWHHNDTLYHSYQNFTEGAKVINESLGKLGAVGFRSPLNLRHPEWMQALNIEYDLSFFDTDPFEPIPGGTMSIWPFRIGHFIELPATLVQDNTLVTLLGETTPRIWLEKVDFLQKYHGMALLNSHPDYLVRRPIWNVYKQFLEEMRDRKGYWNALPRQAASWWRQRMNGSSLKETLGDNLIEANLVNDQLVFNW
jgi:peptidoglycan/xylan/chitin deacetylase (PgdA/CDA1 family)